MKNIENIAAYLAQKGSVKQRVYANTLDFFNMMKNAGGQTLQSFKELMPINKGEHLDIQFFDSGKYETELRFAGDSLILQMHTNVFDFPEDHFIQKLEMVLEDKSASYCGMILIYNFLADSIRYNRYADVGYLLGRVFVNKDGHFFIQGRRQFSFMYHDFQKQTISEEFAQSIVLTAIKQAIDFDLYVPPFDAVKEINLQQKIIQMGNSAIKTGKRLGFLYNSQQEE